MSLMGATNAAITGLAAQSQALSNVSNNLANSDTTAYKASKTSFSSLVAGSGNNKSGGVHASNTTNNTAQGLVTDSAISTHLAIQGNGYFVVSEEGDTSSRYYTRNGEFAVDNDGYLMNGDYYLLGWATDADGNVAGGASSVNLDKIDLSSIQSSAQATSEASIQATLPGDAVLNSTFESSFEVYDSLGTASTITATYEKTAQNTWTITYSDPVSADTSTTTGSVTSSPITVQFNNDGSLASVSGTDLDITWNTGAAASSIKLDLGTVGGSDGLTQYSSNDVENADIDVKSIIVDGRAYGTVDDIEIETDGSVVATFSNGETRNIYKIPVATFINSDGLTEDSDGIYAISTYSGNATLHTAGTGSAGSLKSSSLESSTVDTSTEFASMLSAQQAYSSASQIISTAGDMFDSLLQAVR
ncbi:flagellar hook protein FlgE [Cohaesibacter marisflavi]|uniref:Flagellar hook protein FlgE n=1 Tax=Cohaesibacter marisflavi TaxID=655353 RepID=A0A1I5CF08_9HYPH|nr:flagellar hook protein FlgE [Cohaesibacter marisflavi]SFN85392.1 flagellar hook protein FlgE [Cohaesibacter marisflavi]